MTSLIPTRYSDKNNSTFFDVSGLLITVGYEVTSRRRMFVLPDTSLARIEAKLGDGPTPIAHEYAIPRSYRVGGEIGHVERGLYGFVDEVVRSAVQLKALESAEKEVEAAESEHLFFEGISEVEGERGRTREFGARAATEGRFVDELVTRVLTAVRHLTNVTSLTRDGLEAYQRDRSQAIEKVLESTSLTSAVQVQGVLQAVEAFLHFEVESTKDVKVLRTRTIEYLDYLQSRRSGSAPVVSEEQVQVIANEFVPGYVDMKKRYDAAVAFPRDVVGHAFGSFFAGGIGGWIALSWLGESVIRGISGASVDIPGWYIGAAIAFVAPYVRALYGAVTREQQYDRRRLALLRKIGSRLELAPPAAGSITNL